MGACESESELFSISVPLPSPVPKAWLQSASEGGIDKGLATLTFYFLTDTLPTNPAFPCASSWSYILRLSVILYMEAYNSYFGYLYFLHLPSLFLHFYIFIFLHFIPCLFFHFSQALIWTLSMCPDSEHLAVFSALVIITTVIQHFNNRTELVTAKFLRLPLIIKPIHFNSSITDWASWH